MPDVKGAQLLLARGMDRDAGSLAQGSSGEAPALSDALPSTLTVLTVNTSSGMGGAALAREAAVGRRVVGGVGGLRGVGGLGGGERGIALADVHAGRAVLPHVAVRAVGGAGELAGSSEQEGRGGQRGGPPVVLLALAAAPLVFALALGARVLLRRLRRRKREPRAL